MRPVNALSLVLLLTIAAHAQTTPIALEIDASDAPRKVLHARLQVPVQSGKFTLLYPKWIPGEHSPSGPLNDLVDLKITASEKTLTWRRDPEQMHAFHVEVPAGVTAIDVKFDLIFNASAKLSDIKWNRALLYPAGCTASDLKYTATLRLPEGWKFGTALPVEKQTGQQIAFQTVSLETLVDSPVIIGEHFRTFDLTPAKQPSHLLHVVAESPQAIEAKPEFIAHLTNLCNEANALFGAHHYRNYHFLLTLSNHIGFGGLEHHESSENSVNERSVIDEDLHKLWADLLPHEMAHSWNGKFRRPAEIATPDFQQPMKTELLWVYEGLTEYLGAVLAARSGLWSEETFRQSAALEAALLDVQGGRKWRPLADTAVAAHMIYEAPSEWRSRRRGTDYYSEAALIWLEADAIIRQQTNGQRSLDDFCRLFHGGASGPPRVVPYSFDDVVTTLNDISPYDWRKFLQTRIYEINPRAPLGGIEACGWKLVYKDEPSELLKGIEGDRKFTQLSFSLGFSIREDGTISDVVSGSPADRAGVAPNMKLVAVNNRKWSVEVLRDVIKSSKTDQRAIELLVENAEYFKTCKLDYHDGERYPDLERDEAKPDLLAQILKPLVSPPTTAPAEK